VLPKRNDEQTYRISVVVEVTIFSAVAASFQNSKKYRKSNKRVVMAMLFIGYVEFRNGKGILKRRLTLNFQIKSQVCLIDS